MSLALGLITVMDRDERPALGVDTRFVEMGRQRLFTKVELTFAKVLIADIAFSTEINTLGECKTDN